MGGAGWLEVSVGRPGAIVSDLLGLVQACWGWFKLVGACWGLLRLVGAGLSLLGLVGACLSLFGLVEAGLSPAPA